jgi:hypothetical protein
MSEIKTVKTKTELEEPEKDEIEELAEEDEELEESESKAEIERIDSKSENRQVLLELPKKLWQKVEKHANMLDMTKREFVIEALNRFITQLDDTSVIESILSETDAVDEILSRLKDKGITILTPKAIHKLQQALQGKWCYSLNCDKFTEFCKKVGLDKEEAENTEYAFIIKWK